MRPQTSVDDEDSSEPLNQSYLTAFDHITSDPNNELVIAEIKKGLVGMLQLTYIPYLTYIGSWRCLIEGVRIHKEFRGKGVGSRLLEWAVIRAKEKHCTIVQLTSDKQRPDAIKFYESLGFQPSHVGLKLQIG